MLVIFQFKLPRYTLTCPLPTEWNCMQAALKSTVVIIGPWNCTQALLEGTLNPNVIFTAPCWSGSSKPFAKLLMLCIRRAKAGRSHSPVPKKKANASQKRFRAYSPP